MIKQLTCVIGLLVLAMASYAQNSIYVKGASHQGQVRLRWAPASIGSFQKGNQHGYRVVRQLLARNGAPVSAQEQSGSTTVFGPFKPLPDAQWDPIADTSDIAGVAQGAIYADDFVAGPMGDPFTQAKDINDQNENRYAFALVAADQSYTVAGYMGLAFTDNTAATLEPNGEFLYRVILLTPDSTSRPRE